MPRNELHAAVCVAPQGALAGGRKVLWQPGRDRADPDTYDQAVLSELQMLLEFVAGRPELTVRNLTVADPADPERQLSLADVTARLSEIEDSLDAGRVLDAAARTLLLSVRDALNAIVRPASGVSIAYTAMVLRTSRGRFSRARAALAQRAFPGLATAAAWHRRWHLLLLMLAGLLTAAAVWESTKVALGQSLLRSRSELRVQQQAITAEKAQVEAVLARGAALPFDRIGLGGQTPTVRLCDRPALLAHAAAQTHPPSASAVALPDLFESPEEQDVCDRDRILAYHFASSVVQLRQYRSDWAGMVGGGFAVVRHLVRRADIGAAPARGDAAKDDDLEYSIAPDLLVTGNYVLPVLFAILGASAYAVRDFYGKAAGNLLLPGDRMLSWVRLILGVLIGACIGLFLSSGPPAPPAAADNLLGALTLSASGLAFIGGYGVEGVFSMLNVLVGRVFDSKAAAN